MERKRAPSGITFANSVLLHFGSPLQAKWAAKTLAPDRLYDVIIERRDDVEQFDVEQFEQYLADAKDVYDDSADDGVSWTQSSGPKTPGCNTHPGTSEDEEARRAREELREARNEARREQESRKASAGSLFDPPGTTTGSSPIISKSGGGGDYSAARHDPFQKYVNCERVAVNLAKEANQPFCRLMSQYLESNADAVLCDILETEKALNALLTEEEKRKREETEVFATGAGYAPRAVPRRVLNNAEVVS